MSPRTRHVAWTGWDDDPDRLEAATVTVRGDRLAALGTSRATTYATAWALRTGPGWVTEHLDVSVRGLGWSRHLDLVRTPDGAWRADVREAGTPPSGLAAPGVEGPATLDGALDCDIALCPVTNTMPILRLGLLGDDPPAHEPLDLATGQGVVTYTSATRDFTADLTVDADGLVVDYPELARRL